MAVAYIPAAHAVDWRFEPSVGAAATYSDNANQSANDPQDALILSVTPGFSLRSTGSRRVQASLQYGLSGVARFGEGNDTDLNHNLGAVGKAELIEDFLFIDGTARISQELISLFGSPAGADVNASNRATVGTWSLSPYVQQRFGTFATAQARYTTGGAIFGDNAASDSVTNAFTAGLASGTRFNDFSWGLNYSIRKASNSKGADTTFESAAASLGYALTRKVRVFGTAGQDWNDYLSASGTDGTSYSVGLGWSPTRRTSLEASVGERYFGRTYSFSGNHRTRQTQWNVRYSEDVSDITQQLLTESSRIFWICPTLSGSRLVEAAVAPDAACTGPVSSGELARLYGSLGVPLSELIAAGLLNTGIAQGVFVIKSLNAGVSWNLGRLGLGFSAQDTKRLYQQIGNRQDHVQGATGSASYRLSPRTTANSSLSLTRTSQDGVGPAREDDTLNLNLGVNHRFADKLNGALTFRHTQRDSNAANSNFNENSLTASVNMRF